MLINTLKNEYPEFGLEARSVSSYRIAVQLVKEGRLVPKIIK